MASRCCTSTRRHRSTARPDFSQARGLDTLELLNRSSIDLATLRQGLTTLPDELLEGMGLGAGEVAALRAASTVVSGQRPD